MFDRRVFFAALLILLTAIASSLLLSFSAQRGMGELRIDNLSIESQTGSNVSIMVYDQYYSTYDARKPIVISLHGPQRSVSSLYAFNIELARRNITVISVEIENLSNIVTTMDEDALNETGFRCAEAVDYIRTNYNVDDSIYGIVTHAEGFQVALRMMNFTGTPDAFMAIGDIGSTDSSLFDSITGNFLMAIGDANNAISVETGRTIVESLSGISNLQTGETYGSFEYDNAFRLITGVANQDTEIINAEFVKEGCNWMIRGLQGDDQVDRTLDVNQQIFQYQIYSDWIIGFSIIGSVISGVLFLSNLAYRGFKSKDINPHIDGS
ncbi:MAG: hypothetical protein ACFFED_06795 [Candidatus Thorarchaeota archaeon]